MASNEDCFVIVKEKNKPKTQGIDKNKEVSSFVDQGRRMTSARRSSENESKKFDNFKKEGNIEIWIANVLPLGDMKLILTDRLKELREYPCGKIEKLWDCLHGQLQKILKPNKYEFQNADALKNHIYEFPECSSKEHLSMAKVASVKACHIKFYSIHDNLQPIVYGKHQTTSVILLHIGEYYFMPMSSTKTVEYILSSEDNALLDSLNIQKCEPQSHTHAVQKQKSILKDLTNKVKDMKYQQDHSSSPIQRKKLRGRYYDWYPSELLAKDKDLEKCTLKLQGAHSGIATVISTVSSKKPKKITLMNRKNCGYNAFEGDTVYVKINDRENLTGRVVGVFQSSHETINSLYICKVCKDQGSLMKPLDNSFPKIHVNNREARIKYNAEKKSVSLKTSQKSDHIKEMESEKFADNMYVSIYCMEVDKEDSKVNFVKPKIEEFNPETCEDLFVVCYNWWYIDDMYPSGHVVARLSTFDSLSNSLHIISSICKMEYPIKKDKEIARIKNKINEVKDLPHDIVPMGAMIFTVDDARTEDMDDALSYHVTNDVTTVGVHITDVTKYVTPEDVTYKQAEQRFLSLYPENEAPIHLFDRELATKYLSLLPDEVRAVVSVMFHFRKGTDDTFTVSDVTVHETFIKSKFRLSYLTAESYIRETARPVDVDNDLFIAVKCCYEIAKQIRHRRLPDSYFLGENNIKLDNRTDDVFRARILVEEFMVLANEHVAKTIYQKFPNMSLLRVQDPVTEFADWQQSLFENTNMNFHSSLKHCCNLLGISSATRNLRELTATRQFYDDFVRYLDSDLDKARSLLRYDRYFNDFYIYLTEWFRMNHPSTYECSSMNRVNNRHFNLQMDLYTHFTSPIRRFADVVVHRLLKSAISKTGTRCNLSDQDVIRVCDIGNQKRRMAVLFKNLCAPYGMFEDSSSRCSYFLDCVCCEITNDELHLFNASLESSNSVKCIKFAHLSLNEQPVQVIRNEIPKECNLKWKKVIFSCDPRSTSSEGPTFVIDSHLYDVTLGDWSHALFSKTRRSYLSPQELREDLFELRRRFKKSTDTCRITSDSNALTDPNINITLRVSIKNSVRVQFCSHKVNGLQRIIPELFVATPTLQLCLFHQEDPVKCFVPGGQLNIVHNKIILKFESIAQYQKYFRPMILVESLLEILSEKSEFTLIDVPIIWSRAVSSGTNKMELFGAIKLEDSFCTDKNIMFSDEHDIPVDRYEYITSHGLEAVSGDLLCLRGIKGTWNNYWIGHGEVLNVCKLKENEGTFKVIFFILTHFNNDIFKNDSVYKKMTFSVDVFLRSVISKRQLEAVSSINKNKFMEQIILGHRLTLTDEDIGNMMINNIMDHIRKLRIQTPNGNQQNAINKALTQKLSLIWGPPGTGKTSIGCILAYAYYLKNQKLGKGGVVLYCGPSNDCVNLVAIEMQRKFGNSCPRMLRIFGEQQELADFPLPGFNCRNKKPLTGEMQKISLHFLVREIKDPLPDSLRDFDAQFKGLRDNQQTLGSNADVRSTVHRMIKSYRFKLKEMKSCLLEKEKYSMILCTTSVSATKIMEKFNITQVIIDEAGMCKEPETLIPILSAAETVENVVLIGDHKQLRPIIHSTLAGKCGLQISMFERYQELRKDLVTMLDYQYRMHPSICEFPSTHFYSSKLMTTVSHLWSGLGSDNITGDYKYWNGIDYSRAKWRHEEILKQSTYSAISNAEWPGQRKFPYQCFNTHFSTYPERLIFIHVVGDEETQSVSTAVGNEKSKANMVEVNAVAVIYQKLIDRLEPPRRAPSFITVLTQYKLQEDRLFDACKKILMKREISSDPIVKTVIRSQGSENEYIIFSTVRSIRNISDINYNSSVGWERKFLGFITDGNQVNVALTRAKKGLIIIGNKNLLSVNKMWKNLLDNLQRRGCVVDGVHSFLS